MPPPVFRFAPSPNGYLHLGHAYSALLNFDLARQARRTDSCCASRISTPRDAGRNSRRRSMKTSPGSASWETPVRRQSEHFAGYREAVEKLSAQGLIYPSFESRAEIARLVAQRETGAAMAARSRRRAALSGCGEVACRGRARATDRIRARPTRCGSTWRRRYARAGGSHLGRAGRRARRRDRRGRRAGRKPGATSSWRARRRRPAIICRS